jgi:hypothetical protein
VAGGGGNKLKGRYFSRKNCPKTSFMLKLLPRAGTIKGLQQLTCHALVADEGMSW